MCSFISDCELRSTIERTADNLSERAGNLLDMHFKAASDSREEKAHEIKRGLQLVLLRTCDARSHFDDEAAHRSLEEVAENLKSLEQELALVAV